MTPLRHKYIFMAKKMCLKTGIYYRISHFFYNILPISLILFYSMMNNLIRLGCCKEWVYQPNGQAPLIQVVQPSD